MEATRAGRTGPGAAGETIERGLLPSFVLRPDAGELPAEPWVGPTPMVPRDAVQAVVPLGAGGGAFRVELPDGTRFVFKPRGSQRMVRRPYIPRERAHLREIGAFVVSHQTGLGVVPPTILGRVELGPDDWPLGAIQAWVDGQQPIEIAVEELAAIAALDYIIGNTDRHRGNLIESPSGAFWAIDHTASFPDLVGSVREGFRGEGRSTQENRMLEAAWECRRLPEPVVERLRQADPRLLWHALLELRLESEASGAARDRLAHLQETGTIPAFTTSATRQLLAALRRLGNLTGR